MRRLIFLASILLFTGPMMAAAFPATPVATIGSSNDPWERDLAQDPRALGQCDGSLTWIGAPYFRPVTDAALSAATRRLDRVPVMALTDEEASTLLGLDGPGSGAAARYFDARIAELRAMRRQVMEQRQGSWSLADQQDLDAMLAIRNGPRLSSFRPYLVRGLAAAGSDGSFSLQACGPSLVVMNIARGRMPARPVHRALVVFLESAPGDAFPTWAVSDPDQRH